MNGIYWIIFLTLITLLFTITIACSNGYNKTYHDESNGGDVSLELLLSSSVSNQPKKSYLKNNNLKKDSRKLLPKTGYLIEFWIIVPCYKQQKYVTKAINSIINQNVKFQLLVVDDGTKNKECHNQAIKEIDRLNIHHQAKSVWVENKGLSATRKRGYEILKQFHNSSNPSSIFLLFLDADDRLGDNYLINAEKVIKSIPEVNIIYANQVLQTVESSSSSNIDKITFNYTWDIPKLSYESAIKSGPLPVMSVISSSWYEFVGGFPEEMVVGNEDYSFWLKSLEYGVKAKKISGIGSYYLIKKGSMMRSETYTQLAIPLLHASHPSLISDGPLASAVHAIFCKLSESVYQEMEKRTLSSSNTNSILLCNMYLWMQLYTIRTNDKVAYYTIHEKLKQCTSHDNSSNNYVTYDTVVPIEFMNHFESLKTMQCNDDGFQLLYELIVSSKHIQLLRLQAMISFTISALKSNIIGDCNLHILFINHIEKNKNAQRLINYIKNINGVEISQISSENSIDSLNNEIQLLFKNKNKIDGLVLDMKGKEKFVLDIFIKLQRFNDLRFIAMKYNKIAMDKIGPLPATEYMSKTFGDKGFIFMNSNLEIGNHDGQFSGFLSNTLPKYILLRSPLYPYSTTTCFSLLNNNNNNNDDSKLLQITTKLERIPKIVHFIFGLSNSASERHFEMYHYLSIKAAYDNLNPTTIFIHYRNKPYGIWWNKVLPYVTLQKVRDVKTIFGNSVTNFAHKADVIRLEVLLKYGGIYLDSDTWLIQDFSKILLDGKYDFVMGQEGPLGAVGLCNAIIIAKPNAKFLQIWYNEYRHFSSQNWNEFSVLLPNKLAMQYPSLIHIEPHTSFFWPMWDANGLARLYLRTDCEWINRGYAVHLWSSKASSHLQEITSNSLYSYDTCLFKLARKIYYGNDIQNILLEKEVMYGVLVDTYETIHLVLRTWGSVATEFGFQLAIYTTTIDIINKCTKFVESYSGASITLLKSSIHSNQNDDWKPFFMFHDMYKKYAKSIKWFGKIDADAFLRPEKLWEILSQYNYNEPYYLAAIAEYHGFVDEINQQNMVRLRYGQGHTYMMNIATLRLLSDNILECNNNLWSEDKAMALCIRRYVGIGPVSINAVYSPLIKHEILERNNIVVSHHESSKEIIQMVHFFYSRRSTVVPLLTNSHYLIEWKRKVFESSYLSDPNDFRKHEQLSNRGSMISLRINQCFTSEKVCGWIDITRSECLQIGCCYKDNLPKHKCIGLNGTPQTEFKLGDNPILHGTYTAQRLCSRPGYTPPTLVASPKVINIINQKGYHNIYQFLWNEYNLASQNSLDCIDWTFNSLNQIESNNNFYGESDNDTSNIEENSNNNYCHVPKIIWKQSCNNNNNNNQDKEKIWNNIGNIFSINSKVLSSFTESSILATNHNWIIQFSKNNNNFTEYGIKFRCFYIDSFSLLSTPICVLKFGAEKVSVFSEFKAKTLPIRVQHKKAEVKPSNFLYNQSPKDFALTIQMYEAEKEEGNYDCTSYVERYPDIQAYAGTNCYNLDTRMRAFHHWKFVGKKTGLNAMKA